jgi:hypothetical protein
MVILTGVAVTLLRLSLYRPQVDTLFLTVVTLTGHVPPLQVP